VSKTRKRDIDVFAWEPPPAKGPADRFQRSDRYKYESGTPRPFVSQHNFHLDEPSQALRKPVQGSPVREGGPVKFYTPNTIKTIGSGKGK